ncbi:ubiquitin carboxyl-terminal hydrolase 15 isoform X1 [Octopus bimaculoides]|uniref:ubiquitinyl hydrolase 1 n=2 Tax=Octopus bimaculoides TaxID=37653 RepID=A0A0L8HS15_OCTBM|nr:ubiquitin carboxyl-terminal hydrolase 15 isoform X1 [Octopus bimaculoides]|eukprot:XP_014770306.1 PREDICTED: ubiquitin carboxyl-terminal hydrolase 15-like [Octopus bimaculoides]
MAEGGPPDCANQKKEIDNLLKTVLKKGDTWYLVDTKWLKQWKKYVGFDSWDSYSAGDQSANPGPIDNKTLFKEDMCTLKEHLIDELDYVLLPTEGWNKLVSWYGTVEGQEPIARKVIEQGMFVKHCKVEVYLIDLKLCHNSDLEDVHTKQFSRAVTIDQIEKEMRKLFNIADDKDTRLWNRYMCNTYEHLSKTDNTIQDAGLYQGQLILIEPQNEDGTWPRQAKSTSSYNASSTPIERQPYISTRSSAYSYSPHDGNYSSYGCYNNESGRSQAVPGLCGLSNLGNTCFMNSALQCMSNVSSLTNYFLEEKWNDELNEDNPLGMQGEIARTYAELAKLMWSGRYTYTVPRNFKIAVGKFAPQFSGFQQQDSQELMAFLLDGLHEDLNRIRKKPYIELKDAENRPDKEVAEEAWGNYRKRNDSVIVDTFHGLLKSTLVCPQCSKVSVTFDPFCYLSLPLPIKKERQMEVFWVPLDPAKHPVQYKLTVPKLGTVSDLCSALSKYVNKPADQMIVTDVYSHKFHKIYSKEDGLSPITDRDDIFIYEVPLMDDHIVILPIYMREKKVKVAYNDTPITSYSLFGQPLLLPVPRKHCTYEILYNLVLNRISRYVKVPDESEKWWIDDDVKNRSDEDDELEEDLDNLDVVPKPLYSVNGENNSQMEEMDDSCDSPLEESPKGNLPYSSNLNCTDTSTTLTNNLNNSVGPASSSTTNSNITATSGKSKTELKQSCEDNINTDIETEENENQPPHRLFRFTPVNSYGTAAVDNRMDESGKPLELTSQTYIAIDWDMKAKMKFYSESVAETIDIHESMRQKNTMKKQTIQLNECLELFTTKEKLGADDPWYCPQCKKHQQATKKFDLWSLPNILVIHLKRFSYNRYWRDKIDTLVEFPTCNLNLKKYIINNNHGPATYDLISVSNHYGGMGGGHYTAFAKNKDDKEWYYFDDSTVSASSEDAVVTKAAYVLVYQRQGIPDPSQKKRSKMNNATCSSLAGGSGQAAAAVTAAAAATTAAAVGAPPPSFPQTESQDRNTNGIEDTDDDDDDDDEAMDIN